MQAFIEAQFIQHISISCCFSFMLMHIPDWSKALVFAPEHRLKHTSHIMCTTLNIETLSTLVLALVGCWCG
jgi:2-polyprenyl-3-methyl-5-hydroxy-6-metoxy-1,4-benzoquinol methylase